MSHFQNLLSGYKHNTLSTEELKEFFGLLPDNMEVVEDNLMTSFEQGDLPGFDNLEQKENVYKNIVERTKTKGKIVSLWRKAVAAAACLVLIIVALNIFQRKPAGVVAHNPKALAKPENFADIAPGGDKAVLTLANGSKIVLDSLQNGTIAQEGGAKISKLDNGDITYHNNNRAAGEMQYNTITTPKGGQYHIQLEDGTNVWLNASSKLRFPTNFTAPERVVTLEGEGYFEVAKNAARPFKVKLKDNKEVQVLGTHFNINAYSDENDVNATLLEGSVKVSNGATSRLIVPGQQASMNNNGSMQEMRINAVDTNAVVAWKKGYFSFYDVEINALMRQVARWYDIEVVFENNHPGQRFSGGMQRSLTLKQVMKILAANGIKYRLEGKKLILE